MLMEKCTGPACPRCGCQDTDILRMPEGQSGQPPFVGGNEAFAWGGGSWMASGRARCRHCGTGFSFRELPEEPAPEEIESATLPIDPTICPDCGGKRPAYKTKGRTQHRKCKGCGKTSKTTRRAG